jgi:hypothetical protein
MQLEISHQLLQHIHLVPEGVCSDWYPCLYQNAGIVFQIGLDHFLPISISVFRNHATIFIITHSWSWALLEKLPVVQLLNIFPGFYGTRRLITVFTRAIHWSLSWARSVQSVLSHPIVLRLILILFPHLRLGLSSSLFPSGFTTRILHSLLLSLMHVTCPAHLDHSNYICWRVWVLKFLLNPHRTALCRGTR